MAELRHIERISASLDTLRTNLDLLQIAIATGTVETLCWKGSADHPNGTLYVGAAQYSILESSGAVTYRDNDFGKVTAHGDMVFNDELIYGGNVNTNIKATSTNVTVRERGYNLLQLGVSGILLNGDATPTATLTMLDKNGNGLLVANPTAIGVVIARGTVPTASSILTASTKHSTSATTFTDVAYPVDLQVEKASNVSQGVGTGAGVGLSLSPQVYDNSIVYNGGVFGVRTLNNTTKDTELLFGIKDTAGTMKYPLFMRNNTDVFTVARTRADTPTFGNWTRDANTKVEYRMVGKRVYVNACYSGATASSPAVYAIAVALPVTPLNDVPVYIPVVLVDASGPTSSIATGYLAGDLTINIAGAMGPPPNFKTSTTYAVYASFSYEAA